MSFKGSGLHTKQAHVKIPKDHYEEEHGRNGFFGKVSQLYHQNPLTSWTNIKGELKPRALTNLFDRPEVQDQFVDVLYNNDARISYQRLNVKKSYFSRNADFDEMYFFHKGEGRIETIYGHLNYKVGDYVILPRGTTYKVYPDSASDILRVEATSEFEQPDRGLLGPNALYDQTAIETPEAALGTEKLDEYVVHIKREGEFTEVTYPFNPLDVSGWKGNLYPWKLSIYDYCPINSHKYHMPPSAHTTFVCKNFVVCSFVARPLEHSSEEVLKVPFYHSNIDFDEVLFYHQGNFFSRDNIDAGALTFHPQGIHHGPHPNAFKNTMDKEWTDEFAVMIDTKYPLIRSSFFKEQENKNYWKSWM